MNASIESVEERLDAIQQLIWYYEKMDDEADPVGDEECSEYGAMLKCTKIFLNEYRDVLVELILRKRAERRMNNDQDD